MDKKLVVAHPQTNQRRVVYLALLHCIKAVPVVDKKNRLLGIVPYDHILKIFPVLVYMSDAVGTQSEALIIRSIALDPELPIKSYVLREFKIVGILALTCGVLIGIVALIGWGTYLGLIVGFSMFLSIIAAVSIPTLLPLAFRRLIYDPAIATGPFATLISDIVTLAIYFSVAILFIDYLNLI